MIKISNLFFLKNKGNASSVELLRFANIKLFTILFPVTLILSGCAGMNSQFSCNKVGGKGVGCASMDQVNHMIDQGAFNKSSTSPTAQSTATQPTLTSYNVSAPTAGEPVRYSETIQQVWIAPYEDTAGNYHEPSLLYAVIKPSHWIGLPEEAIQNSDS